MRSRADGGLASSAASSLPVSTRARDLLVDRGIIGWFAGQHRAHIAQLRELAERDFLTDLLNTRMFDEALARRCASGRRFALLLGDMDNLKQINDAHGHAEGNRVLRSVGQLLRGLAGESAEVARVGGDEFGILIDADLEQATEGCARLQRLLAGQGYEMSFGWAAMPDDGVAPLELFRKADDRLFAAKLLGRNRRAVQALATAPLLTKRLSAADRVIPGP